MSIQVTPALIKKLAKGSLFGIQYVKKDGELGSMSCRFGVKKHLTTKPEDRKPVDPNAAPKKHITVYCSHKNGYRSIIIENILSITIKGVELDLRDLKNIVIMEAAQEVQVALANGFDEDDYVTFPSDYEADMDERLVA